ncbi:MAG: hypothetical protein HOO96_44035 [Polyangiaceae bacterium]|nr:hypothetical protein [Polyangiaceae bacterium]
MSVVTVPIQMYSRRQNTNKGDAQYRIWFPRSDANVVARHIPALQLALASNKTWSTEIGISWRNGGVTEPFLLGAYANQSGEMSFTAPSGSKLFTFAAQRHHSAAEHVAIPGSCRIENGAIVSIVLDVAL